MSHRFARLLLGSALWSVCSSVWAQVDPGVRGGLAGTGGGLQQRGIAIPHPPLMSPNPKTAATMNDNERASFEEGILRAGQLESTCDTCADVIDGSPVPGELDPVFPQIRTNSNGLGARHNADQCFVCHAQPTLGGSGGFIVPNPGDRIAQPAENPQFRLVPHRFGRLNVVPSFEQQYGPIREVRFKYNPDGSRDGGVHQLWTVRGSTNDPTISGCALQQPDFEAEYRAGNLAFRIPLQMLGLGLIESISDREILARHAATALQRARLGIGGHPNRSGNDGTLTRFGWKAQNKSLVVFAGEAYNVEMGITNEVFPTPTEEDPACQGSNKPAPNDIVRTDANEAKNQAFDNPLHILPDWLQFMMLMRFTDGPSPDPNPGTSARRGAAIFTSVGCALCHTPQLQTAPVMNSAVLQDRPVNLFSDLMVHHMGAGLADNVVQGQAGPDEFRTTPLWGVGQRIFFLHDGRTSDLLQAIRAHFSQPTQGDTDGQQESVLTRLFAGPSAEVRPRSPAYGASEANAVIRRFNDLPVDDQQAVLDFLRSL
jgi:Di-haem oxidoreductase, putative peroxidase